MQSALPANVLTFARALRGSGLRIPPVAVREALRALETIGIARRADVRDALRTTLVKRHEDDVVFNTLFDRFWRVWPDGSSGLPQPLQVPGRTRTRVSASAPGSVTPPAAGR